MFGGVTVFVDLSILELYGKSVVRCTTKEFAEIFIDAMWEQYPDKMRPAWELGQTNWNINTTSEWYLPRIHISRDDYVEFCQSANFRHSGYEVVLFKDLVDSPDFGELSQSEMDMKSLLGMG